MTTAQSIVARTNGTRRGWRLAGLALVVLVLTGATMLGVKYRHWAFEATQVGRFRGDIQRNFNFGVNVLENGYLNIYEDQIRGNVSRDQKLDYPPLRLATFTAWAAWTRWSRPDAFEWEPDFEFNAFLMWHNTILAWLGCLAALLIVRHWLRESARADLPPPGDDAGRLRPGVGMVHGVLAFLLLWFDPGMAIIGHGWPSPNLWAVPYYLWTVYLCLCDCWFVAGVVMGIAAMLQGQQLFVAGVFVLWPIFAGRPMRAIRWVSGFTLAFALIASGWLVTRRPDPDLPERVMNWPAVVWVLGSAAALSLVGLRSTFTRLHWAWFVAPAAAAVAILCWPVIATGRSVLAIGIPAVAVVAGFWWLRWTTKRYLLALTVAVCLFSCVELFGSSNAWWKIGFLYGVERFPVMAFDTTNNLAAMCQNYFGWRSIDDVVMVIPSAVLGRWPALPMVISIQQFLFGIYVILLVAASAAMAMQWRRRDRNLLVALVLPWVLFYTIPAQISPRYAVFAGGVGAICIGRSLGMWLLALMFSALTVVQTALTMMHAAWEHLGRDDDPLLNPHSRRLLEQCNAGLSWVVVLAACVFLWASFCRSRRPAEVQRPRHDQPAAPASPPATASQGSAAA